MNDMNDKNAKPQRYILYIHFLFLINLTCGLNFKSLFLKIWQKKMEDFFQRPASVFLSEIFKCKVLQQIQFYLRLFLKNI